jgi:AcrR family transcriptional regulator
MATREAAAKSALAAGASGRPRSADADEAITRSTLDLLERDGYLRLSIEQVAEAAGVSKATIYRRYRDKAELVGAAIASRAGFLKTPDTGSVRTDLRELMRQARAKLESPAGFALAGVLLAEEPHRPESVAAFREQVILPRRERYAIALRRGIERGELRADFDIYAVVDAMVGACYARHLAGERITESWSEAMLDALLSGIAKARRR